MPQVRTRTLARLLSAAFALGGLTALWLFNTLALGLALGLIAVVALRRPR